MPSDQPLAAATKDRQLRARLQCHTEQSIRTESLMLLDHEYGMNRHASGVARIAIHLTDIQLSVCGIVSAG